MADILTDRLEPTSRVVEPIRQQSGNDASPERRRRPARTPVPREDEDLAEDLESQPHKLDRLA